MNISASHIIMISPQDKISLQLNYTYSKIVTKINVAQKHLEFPVSLNLLEILQHVFRIKHGDKSGSGSWYDDDRCTGT